MAENIQLNIEETTEENEMSLDNFIVNNDDFVNRRNRRLGITTNTQRQVDKIWDEYGETLLNKALNSEYINATTIPFEDARLEALKLWRQGIAWPTVQDIPHQERHQDWMRRKCKMLFNTNWKPDCYAWAILMLLGPRNLRSTELKCWEDCYDFLDFAEDKDNDGKEEGMFKPVFYVPVDGESLKCACQQPIGNLYEVTCKDVEYNKDGSIDTIKMRALHLGCDCIYKRSIVPKIKDEVDKHGKINPTPILKKMVFEVAKRVKKKCARCNELKLGFTSKFDNCKDCRKELKRIEEEAKREEKRLKEFIQKVKINAIKIIRGYTKIWALTGNDRLKAWKHIYQNGVKISRTWGWIAENDIDHIYDAYNNEKYDVDEFLEGEKGKWLADVIYDCVTIDEVEDLYRSRLAFKEAKKELRYLIHYKIFFEKIIKEDAAKRRDNETIRDIDNNEKETDFLIEECKWLWNEKYL